MSKKSKKVINRNKITELLDSKEKEMLGEAFEGMGGIVPMKPIHNMDGAFTKGKAINETIPTLSKEWTSVEKACDVLYKAIDDLSKSAGRLDRGASKEISGLWKYTESSIKKFKKLVVDEILSDLQ